MRRMMYAVSLALCGLLIATSLFAGRLVQIKGSDTMVNLVQILAEQYMEARPGEAIAVTGGGSGVGIAAIINGTVDIANHSRPLKDKEYTSCKENGVVPTTIVIGIDGLSVIVNEKNPLDSLAMEDIGRMYRGEIEMWKQVRGPEKAISLYGRQPNSGTYDFFLEHVLGNKDYSPKMKQMNGNAQIVEAVKTDEGAIGYVGVGYLFDENGAVQKGIKVLKVSHKSGPAYSPLNKDDVRGGRYPIARPIFQTFNGTPKGSVKDFIAFELGPEGQKIVEDEGFFTVAGKYLEDNKKAGF